LHPVPTALNPSEDVAKLLKAIAAKKEQFDKLRPLSPEALANLEHYYNIELTYASNAIEGNTLSPVETTLVIEQGITISGKPLKTCGDVLSHVDRDELGPTSALTSYAADVLRGGGNLVQHSRGPLPLSWEHAPTSCTGCSALGEFFLMTRVRAVSPP
jgi:hypothetical protein